MNLAGNAHYITRANNWLSQKEAKSYRQHPAGAIVFAKIGEALKANRRRILVKPTIIDNNMMSAVAKQGVDESWLFCALESIDFNEVSRGSALPYLAVSDLKEIEIDLPSFEEQKLIANVIAALDKKIENNRRMNEVLEAMAQAIFKDWFVDFGPTHRKLTAKEQDVAADPVAILGGLIPDPEKAAQTAALFPDSFDDDGMPKTWGIETLKDVLELSYGKSLPKTKRTPGPVPVYGSGGVTGSHKEPMVEGPGIVVGRKGTVGSLYWEERDFFPIDTVFFVSPKSQIGLNYLWQLLHTLGLHNMNTDAAVPGLNRDNAYQLKISDPGRPLRDAFEEIAATLQTKLQVNRSENNTLAETRDYLLPRLMSGQIRAGDARKTAS